MFTTNPGTPIKRNGRKEMEIKEAIECLEVASEFQVSINRQEEIKRVISLLKSLEAENKVYRNEQSGWVKEIERRQAKIRELEKLDLNVRELMLENKALKKENEAYKGMWEELENRYIDKPMFNGDAPIILNQQLRWLEQEYLGGGE